MQCPEVHDWILAKFPSVVYTHGYSNAIQNINEENKTGFIKADFSTNDFEVIVAKGDQLLLAQTFLYSTPDDVIYYLLKSCQQFSLSPQEVKLFLSGLIEKQSALFKELYQYFINIEFQNPDWKIYGHDKYPSHFFTSLNDLLRCES